jgi:hypothetical protein
VIVRQADRAFVTLKKGLHREVKPHSLIKKMYMHFLHLYVSPNIAGVIEYGTLQCLPANRQEDFIRKEKKRTEDFRSQECGSSSLPSVIRPFPDKR